MRSPKVAAANGVVSGTLTGKVATVDVITAVAAVAIVVAVVV